ncbi:hypothetical protein M569_12606, partial [Genlisea aurea]
DMASFWGFEENDGADQLGQKLLQATLELEKLRTEAMEEKNSNREYVKQLVALLKAALRERDEARDQLQKYLGDNPEKKPANSSVTESNSLSDNYNRSPPPVEESFFDGVEFPDVDFDSDFVCPLAPAKVDRESLIIDSIARRRVLPERGQLLEAVLRSGPMLQTLLMAGPLPQWRNPPQIKPFQIPPVTVKGRDTTFQIQNTASS